MHKKPLFALSIFALVGMAAFVASAHGFDINHILSHEGTATLLGSAPLASTLPDAVKAQLQRINNEMTDWTQERGNQIKDLSARLQTVEQSIADPAARQFSATKPDGIGATVAAALAEDPSFQAASAQATRGMKVGRFEARINLDQSIRAALVNEGRGDSNSTSYPTWADRRPGIYGPVIPAPRLLDVLPSRPTTSDRVEFAKLSVAGDAAEQEVEGDPKAELLFSGELDSADIVTIAAWTPASKQVLSDNNALGAAIDGALSRKVNSRLENQIINGPGGQGKIHGLLNQATNFVPLLADNSVDALGEALTRLETAGYLPNLVIVHPLDFFSDVQIVKDGDGNYIFGSPNAPQGPTLWNVPIVRTPAMPQGKALVLDTAVATLLDREQMTIAVSNSHADFFVRNLVAILGERRAGLEVLDPSGIYKLDLPGISS